MSTNKQTKNCRLAPIFIFLTVFGLSACGGGGGSGSDDDEPATTTTTTPTTSSKAINGGGVKGPLAFAIVTVYAFDPSKPDFKGDVIATATTNGAAQIENLELPEPLNPPYIVEFTSDAGTRDITTNQPPVITTMRTVLTQTLIDSGEPIYGTPLTTMAVDIAIANALDTNGTAGIQADEFESALTVAAAQVVSTVGFGMSGEIDIFDTPPLVDSTTDSAEEQADVAAYRSAVEALTAVVFQMEEQSAGGSVDAVLGELSLDLADGIIDGTVDSAPSTIFTSTTLDVLAQDPANLPIPTSGPTPTGLTVSDVQAILVSETTTTGTTTSTTELDAGGSIDTAPKPAETNPDTDADGVLNADDAFPDDATESADTDGDGIGDNADPDADNDGVDDGADAFPLNNKEHTDTDSDCGVIVPQNQTTTSGDGCGDNSDPDIDGDGTDNAQDDFPFDKLKKNKNDVDNDGWDIAADPDDDNAAVPGIAFVDTDGDGLADSGGDLEDGDDDNDGVDDGPDAFPLNSNESADTDSDCDEITPQTITSGDGCGDNSDTDIDDDGTDNEQDAFPFDPNESKDTDSDGVGDNADTDADGDDWTDIEEGGTTQDTDADGTPDYLDLDSDNDRILDVNETDLTAVTTVTVINVAPVASNAAPGTDEDTGLAVTLSALATDDVDAPSALVYANTQPTNGVLSGAAPNLTYTPDAEFSGSDSFTFTATDSNGKVSNVATISITVTPLNDAPTATAGSLTVDEDSAANPGNVSGADIDGDSLTYSLSAAASSGTAVVNADGSYTYTPVADFSGSVSFSFVANDGTVDSAPAVVSITVNPLNDAPTATAGSLTVGEDSAANPGNVSGADIDGDSLTYSLSAAASSGTAVVNADGSYTYTPVADFDGSDSFSFVANDGTVDSAPAVVSITVNPLNDAPTATAGSLAVDEDSAANPGNVSGADIDGDSLTYSLSAAASSGTAVVNADGSYTYTPVADFDGSDSFSFVANDGTVDSAPAVVSITVNPLNDAPTATAGSLTVDEDSAANPGNVSGADIDGDSLTYALSTGASKGTAVVNADGSYTYTPVADSNGSDSFSFVVNDGTVDSAPAVVSITVNPLNDAPVANDDLVGVQPGNTVVIDVLDNDTDVDNGVLSITGGSISAPSEGSIPSSDLVAGTITFDATGVSDGTIVTFTYTAFDGALSSAAATVTVQVVANPTPVANAGTLTVAEDSTNNPGTLSATDADPITYALSSQAADGTAVVNADGSYTYTPDSDFSGSDSFTFSADDGISTSTPATITITVTPLNDAPTATGGSLTVDEDSTANPGNVSGADIDGDSLTYSLSAAASSGTAVVNADGSYTYTPVADSNGSDSFSFVANDGTVDSAPAVVSITVNPLNDAPTATAGSLTVDEDSTANPGNVSGADIDGDSLTYALSAAASSGTAVVNVDGFLHLYPCCRLQWFG